MTRGQLFQSLNNYRRRFHQEVIQSAAEVNFRGLHHFIEDDTDFKFAKGSVNGPGLHPNSSDRCVYNTKGVKEAGEELCRFLDPHRLLDSDTSHDGHSLSSLLKSHNLMDTL
jgi:hypothetical protein